VPRRFTVHSRWPQKQLRPSKPGVLPAAAPFFQADWPNPQPARRSPYLLTWTQNLQQSTLAPAVVYIFRDPLVTRIAWPSYHAALNSQPPVNLLGLFAQVEAPFSQRDWPNPQVARRPSDGTWLVNLQQSTLAQTPVPFSQKDWPVPRGQQPVVDLRTWIQNLQQTTFTPAAEAPFRQIDWPNPMISAVLQPPWQAVNLLTYIFAPVEAPFFQTDWPNPRFPAVLQSWQALNLLENTLAALPTPFRQMDWPNPRYPDQAVDLRTWLINLLETTLAPPPGVPFSMTDWPNPRVPLWLGYISTHFRSNSTPAPVIVVPFRQTDWPNPQSLRDIAALRTWITMLQQSDVAPSVVRLLRMLVGVGS
jgi:hypothetical protein